MSKEELIVAIVEILNHASEKALKLIYQFALNLKI